MKKEILTLKKESAPANTNEASINMVIADKDFMKALGVTPEDIIKQVKISEKEFKEISNYVTNYKGTFAELYKELKGWNLGYNDVEKVDDNLFDCYYKSLLVTINVDDGKLSVDPHDVYVYPNDITKVDSDELFHLDFDKPIDYSKINTKVTESRKSLGHKVLKKESIQSVADWITKAKKVMSDIKANKVDYNFYEITSDLEEDIARTDSDIEKDVLTGLLHSLNNAYSKIADKDDKEDIREDKELLVEDLDEAFYEKICRAYIDTMNLEWVTTNPENYDSVVHGYFPDDEEAEKWDYGAKVTPENFKDITKYTDEEIENSDEIIISNGEYYEYETWEDFYEEYVKENIIYDIDDIGTYPSGTTEPYGEWDFYISEEDLTKLGLWNEDMKSEFLDESKKVENSKSEIYDELSKVLTDYEGNGDEDLKDDPKPLYDMLVKIQNNWEDTITSNLDESKKVVEDYSGNVFDKVLSIEDNSGDTIMQFKVANDGSLYGFDNCEVADEEDDLVRIQQVGIFGYDLDESKKIVENYDVNVFDKVLSIEDNSGDTLMQFKIASDGCLYGFDHCEIADEEDNLIRIQQVETFGYNLDEGKKVEGLYKLGNVMGICPNCGEAITETKLNANTDEKYQEN